jgi:hypothetical protein
MMSTTTISPGAQISLHLQCLVHGNYRHMDKVSFHLHGIIRAILQAI